MGSTLRNLTDGVAAKDAVAIDQLIPSILAAFPDIPTIAALKAYDVTLVPKGQPFWVDTKKAPYFLDTAAATVAGDDNFYVAPTVGPGMWARELCPVPEWQTKATNGTGIFISVATGVGNPTTDNRAFWFPSMERVGSNDGNGSWVRLKIRHVPWHCQSTWSIDSSNTTGLASDENSGIDDSHPLLTGAELARRLCGALLSQVTNVRWLSDAIEFFLDLSSVTGGGNITTSSSQSTSPLVITGVPMVVRSGVLTGATDAPWTVTDSTLPVSWTDSGCMSSSSGTRTIRKTDLSKHSQIGYEDTARTASTTPTNGITENFSPFGVLSASFAVGDAYEVISLPKFPRICPPNSVQGFIACYLILLDASSVIGGSSAIKHCGFRTSSTFNMTLRAGVCAVYGSLFVSGGLCSGYSSNTFNRCMWMGSMQPFSWQGDMNGAINVIAKGGSMNVSHGSHCRLGTLHAYDCVGNAIGVSNQSSADLDGILGSGNHSTIITINQHGNSIHCPSGYGNFQATTSAPHPINLNQSFDWTDLQPNGIWIQATQIGVV